MTALPASVLPPSVNYHLIQACNMRCRGCFATFHDVVEGGLPRGILPRAETLAITQALAARFEKITFAGGEPTLCPWLGELIWAAKRAGATTMIVTNGTRLSDTWLADVRGALDWVTLSVDSPHTGTHEALGRAVHGRALTADHYEVLADRVRAFGMRLKVNTVVSALNHQEDFTTHMARLRPERWKIFQVLPVGGQNDAHIDDLLLAEANFQAFVRRHRGLEADGIEVVPEDNEAMTGTYAMVAPNGCFYDNTAGHHRYSRAIQQVGLEAAWADVAFDHAAFEARGGVYDWRGPETVPLVQVGSARPATAPPCGSEPVAQKEVPLTFAAGVDAFAVAHADVHGEAPSDGGFADQLGADGLFEVAGGEAEGFGVGLAPVGEDRELEAAEEGGDGGGAEEGVEEGEAVFGGEEGVAVALDGAGRVAAQEGAAEEDFVEGVEEDVALLGGAKGVEDAAVGVGSAKGGDHAQGEDVAPPEVDELFVIKEDFGGLQVATQEGVAQAQGGGEGAALLGGDGKGGAVEVAVAGGDGEAAAVEGLGDEGGAVEGVVDGVGVFGPAEGGVGVAHAHRGAAGDAAEAEADGAADAGDGLAPVLGEAAM